MTISFARKYLLKQRRFRMMLWSSTLLSVVLGFIIVPIEAGRPESRIHNLSDGLWWSVQTLTTVGYGDTTPVTGLGRLLGVFLVLVGTLMFGTVIAMISSSMSRSQEEFYWNRLFERLDRLEEEMNELKRKNDFLVKDAKSDIRENNAP